MDDAGAQQAAPLLRTCSSGGGIRSLPDALHTTSFQQQLQHLQQQQTACSSDQPRPLLQQPQQQQQPEEHSRQRRRPRAGSKLQHQPASLTAPQRYGPLRGWGFSCWGHATSEYGRAEVLQKLDALRTKAAQVAGEDFVVRGCPPQLRHSPTFSNSTGGTSSSGSSSSLPFQEVDWLGRPLHQQQQQQAVRPFVPAGRGGLPEVRLRGQLPEVVALLDAQLSRSFPGCFIKAFADEDGAIVLSFLEKQQQQQQGGASSTLAACLNHAVQHDPLLVEHRLTRDVSRWGVRDAAGAAGAECSDDDGGAGSPPLLFFVLLPPWCRGGAGRAAAAART